jgi:putative ABC transport system permease protein
VNWRIIGVVGDVKSYLDQPAQPTVFIPLAQAPYEIMKLFEAWIPTEIVVRTTGEPLALGRALQQTLQSVDPNVAAGHIRSMNEIRSAAVAMREFNMTLLSLFAGAALLLAAIGIYGVIAFSVTQRTQELGVRMALGAQRSDVLRLVLGEGLRLAATGIAAGLAGTLALTRVLQTFLYGVSPTDPTALACTTLLLGSIALFACYIPARRAMKVDPMVALRYE